MAGDGKRRCTIKIRLDLEDDLVRRAKLLTGADDAAVAVKKAVEEYVRRATYEGITSLAGKVEFDEEWLEQYRREHLLPEQWPS